MFSNAILVHLTGDMLVIVKMKFITRILMCVMRPFFIQY